MKTTSSKLAVFFLAVFTLTNSATAQSPFTGDSKVLHIGAAVGAYDLNFAGINSTPVVTLSYDHGIVEGLGIGTLAVGGAAGFKYYWAGDFNWTRGFLFARATYHFDFVNSDVFDLYAGAMAGTVFFIGGTDGLNTQSTSVAPGLFAGINYYFSPSFGVFAEAGYGFGFLHGGISFNL